ncbi:nucleoside deaminase [Streptomyces sp. CHA1]|uniref:nucleoside deaminase n=1 Tax=unclassified Streptomyces TaxID=2593676 RepID=UPI001BFC6DA6|nr:MULTISPECIES: nucleoside deaminase [unclassified Streptomyces]UYM26024.1 nucleoside deaminase [Streptomyces albus]WDV34006.1 nucleoside deaminase [Streptomyces sp. AD16]MBT3158982.1 nucleoside deaminase [Streptomyces sp. G11C]MCO6704430.1 nucleoside deaminase [Streptomyces sp. CHB9.2]MCO6710699.1 nucleoside deaminase [Streptomyces sp. CHA3]
MTTTHAQEDGVRALEHAWMEQAIALATDSARSGGGPFGALIAKDGQVVATGHNQVTATLDPSAHAEVSAIRAACKELNTFSLAGCVLITSCEPCPMCLSTALWARVDRVVYAADRHDAAVAGFDDRAFYDLFDKKPQADWPLEVAHLDLPDRTRPFGTWVAKGDRVEY